MREAVAIVERAKVLAAQNATTGALNRKGMAIEARQLHDRLIALVGRALRKASLYLVATGRPQIRRMSRIRRNRIRGQFTALIRRQLISRYGRKSRHLCGIENSDGTFRCSRSR